MRIYPVLITYGELYMYFSKLPENIKAAIVKLTTDDEFQHRFGTDKILDEIEGFKINRAE